MIHKVKMITRDYVHDIPILQKLYVELSGFKTFLLRILDDEAFMHLCYRENTGKKLNLKNPVRFNEKILWLQLHDRNPLYTMLSDKYLVKDYVSRKIGAKHVVDLYDVWDSVDDIPFEKLPEKFVLKCSHDCGTIFIKTKDTALDNKRIKAIKKEFRKALKRNYFYVGRVWSYKNIEPKVFCESLIKTKTGKPPRDYKIFCFDGEPMFAFVASDRGEGTKFDFFDINWKRIPVKQHYPNSSYFIEKPDKWDEMLDHARNLAKDMPQVRVDFYIDADENILFGEMTFCHFAGCVKFEPDEYDFKFGEYIKLPR